MSNPTATSILGRVLLGTSGEGQDFLDLGNHLTGLGWQVDKLLVTEPVGDDTIGSSLPPLDGLHLALLMVGPDDRDAAGGPPPHIVYLAGLLRGRVGDRNVLVLVEDAHETLLAGTGVAELPYERGQLATRFPQIDAMLANRSAGARPTVASTPWLERFGLTDSVGPLLWLALVPLLVLGAAAVLIVFQALSSDDGAAGGGADLDAVAVTTTAQVAGPTTGPATDADDRLGSATVPDDSLAPGSTLGRPLGPGPAPGDDGGRSGAVPGAGMEGGLVGLPATCVIETRKTMTLPDVIPCEGLGGLRVDGWPGPWHNEISFVTVDSGVVGEVLIEPRPAEGSATVVELTGQERQALERYDSLYGVQRLRLVFSANGQRVTLEQREAAGASTATLTFSLDL